MLNHEIRLSTLRERLEDRPNNLDVTVQLGENPTTYSRNMQICSSMSRTEQSNKKGTLHVTVADVLHIV